MIPRSAMVTVDRFDYVFIKTTGNRPTSSSAGRSSQRRKATTSSIVAEPTPDHPGLTPGRKS